MKLFLSILFFSTMSFAQKVCLNIPAAFSPETEITTNFDGSINVENIKLFYKGKYYFVTNEINWQSEDELASGVCSILGKNKVSYSFVNLPKGSAISIDKNGHFTQFTEDYSGNGQWSNIDSVVCR